MLTTHNVRTSREPSPQRACPKSWNALRSVALLPPFPEGAALVVMALLLLAWFRAAADREGGTAGFAGKYNNMATKHRMASTA